MKTLKERYIRSKG